jgi:hypothetical protein
LGIEQAAARLSVTVSIAEVITEPHGSATPSTPAVTRSGLGNAAGGMTIRTEAVVVGAGVAVIGITLGVGVLGVCAEVTPKETTAQTMVNAVAAIIVEHRVFTSLMLYSLSPAFFL